MKCDFALEHTLYLKFGLLCMVIEISVSQWSQILSKARHRNVINP